MFSLVKCVKITSAKSILQQIALDKLSVKVHKLYEKVQDAAMLSVDPHFKDEISGGPTLLQNFEGISEINLCPVHL